MALRRYTPSIARLQEEYSQMIARRVMRSKRPPRRADAPKILDNSEPWNPDPRTVSDLWEIAECVRERVEQFQKWAQPSSNSLPE